MGTGQAPVVQGLSLQARLSLHTPASMGSRLSLARLYICSLICLFPPASRPGALGTKRPDVSDGASGGPRGQVPGGLAPGPSMHELQDLTGPWPLLLESFSGKWGRKQDPRLRARVKVNETEQAKWGSDATPSLRLPVSAVPLTSPSPPHTGHRRRRGRLKGLQRWGTHTDTSRHCRAHPRGPRGQPRHPSHFRVTKAQKQVIKPGSKDPATVARMTSQVAPV